MYEDGILELVRDNVKVEWVNLGEGWDGDYDPDDPEDTNLLRFDVSCRDSINDEWSEVDDGSYCTQMPANTPSKILMLALVEIMDLIYNDIMSVGRSKRICEKMSWLCPEDFGYNVVRESYPDNECPDCGDEISLKAVDGTECDNCGHVFYKESKMEVE